MGQSTLMFSTRWILTGLLLNQFCFAVAAQSTEPKKQDELAPARPHGIGGANGFRTVSNVEFIDYPDAPHEWTARYAYPDRARWSLRPTSGRPTSPMIIQRLGARSWTTPGGKTASVADDVEGVRTSLLQMELRRAFTIWPLGFTWTQPDEEVAQAEVFALQHQKENTPIGYLLANQDASGKLLGIEAFSMDGHSVEELQVKAWRKIEGRMWPSETLLLKQGKPVWKETLTFASSRDFHNDLIFTPPDRRAYIMAQVQSDSRRRLRHVDLPGITFRLRDLKANVAWKEALRLAKVEIKLAQELLQKEAPNAGHIDSTPTIQLDSDGRPTHIVLRLKVAQQIAPKGWGNLPTRAGVGIVLGSVDSVDEQLLKKLGASLPKDSKLGPAYCRVLSRGERTNVQLYQPTID
jgi:hypothetical protein